MPKQERTGPEGVREKVEKMASMMSAESQVLPTPYESKVRSTALAHRFMVRRSLAQFRGAVSADRQTPPPRVLVRTLKAPLSPT